jgi:DNA-binding winged helix-turn-helix (wHTH) protein/predicted ATPase
MPREPVVPVRLDLHNAWVWQGEQRLPLTPKAFAVLRYLMEHAGRVVTKEELLQVVWAGTAVSEGALTTCMREIRKALGERAQAPQYIETVHRRGYRWMAPLLTTAQPIQQATLQGQRRHAALPVVGREAEFAHLHRWLEQARGGARQIVLVAGEAGIGKTTLVDAWLEHVEPEELWSARGQCIEHYGSGEAYLPVLEALGRLCRQPGQAQFIGLLRQYAPTWLVQLPWLLSPAERDALQREVRGTTRERMLREMAEALEVLTAETPLVLILEDLHWSDTATLDLLASLARRREAARLLLIGTYRPVEVIVREHPLRGLSQELQLHGQCTELPLEGLTEGEIAAYLAGRFPGSVLPPELAQVLLQRTEGNPLFMVNVVRYLIAQGVLVQGTGGWEMHGGVEAVERGVPESLRQMIERHSARLSPADQRVLEVASVVGVEFSAAAVAAGVGVAEEQVEERCTALARHQHFLSSRGRSEWPDGTVTAHYSFMHALYQEVWHERVPEGRRRDLHRRIGARLEAGYGTQADAVAAELAVHFEAGREYRRAVQYLGYAAEQALGRCAYQEAIRHLTRGLALLPILPDTPERAQQELALQIALGPVLMATKGQGAPEVEQTYARARALCQQVGDTPQRFAVLWGLQRFYRGQGAFAIARELGEQLVQWAERDADPTRCREAHDALGMTVFFLGDYAAARSHLAQGSTGTGLAAQRECVLRQGEAPGVRSLAFEAWTLWCLGFPAQAVQRGQEALALAQALAHPYSLAGAQVWAADLHHRRREAAAVQAQAEALLPLASAQGLPFFVGAATCYRGWALAMQGQDPVALALLRQGMAAIADTGHTQSRPRWLILLAEAAGYIGQVAEGLRLLAEALEALEANAQGDMRVEAHRLQGELLLRQPTPDAAQAEACFQQALTIARHQQAKSWELRAATSLARLWQHQGKCAEARELLAPVYDWFTEGFDTADLQEAKALLAELAE